MHKGLHKADGRLQPAYDSVNSIQEKEYNELHTQQEIIFSE
jgi:hypothetical protein